MPGRTAGAPRQQGGGGQGEQFAGMSYDSVKRRPLSERCLLGFGSTSGPPMLPVLYNNNYQIVQTPDAIMILVEMVHDVRVVRMNSEHEPPVMRKWLGDSIGHWDGDTLVVETNGFRDDVWLDVEGSPLTNATRLSPWLSPAVENRSIYLSQPKERL